MREREIEIEIEREREEFVTGRFEGGDFVKVNKIS